VLLRDSPVVGAIAMAERLRVAVQNLGIENAGSPERVVTVSIALPVLNSPMRPRP